MKNSAPRCFNHGSFASFHCLSGCFSSCNFLPCHSRVVRIGTSQSLIKRCSHAIALLKYTKRNNFNSDATIIFNGNFPLLIKRTKSRQQ
ncbi:Os03g0604700 [Oryza sativa Japonica Group]|uniref:Os03g0604700 protein n=2 Tax=Oryza sativa subsp. japonica TaxID=39947 RepID=Q0DQE1_ORYSJ|nr:hypothetical protein EE612_018827 [Oryza sativa]BAF12547.1 Os03g0604700 [Oryza sativa Japonica Group]BAS85221.1 Os03g0604700 [Oryza sativa Japonica Group]|eukprot:NP_001050633.1 Os03g0604700 [Oryza sativa Japonica Group]